MQDSEFPMFKSKLQILLTKYSNSSLKMDDTHFKDVEMINQK